MLLVCMTVRAWWPESSNSPSYLTRHKISYGGWGDLSLGRKFCSPFQASVWMDR
jgi:hypothetical protein